MGYVDQSLPWHSATVGADSSYKILASFKSKEEAETFPEGDHIIQTKEQASTLTKFIAGGLGGVAGGIVLSPITTPMGAVIGGALDPSAVLPGYVIGAIAGPVIGGAIGQAIFARDKKVRNVLKKTRLNFGQSTSSPGLEAEKRQGAADQGEPKREEVQQIAKAETKAYEEEEQRKRAAEQQASAEAHTRPSTTEDGRAGRAKAGPMIIPPQQEKHVGLEVQVNPIRLYLGGWMLINGAYFIALAVGLTVLISQADALALALVVAFWTIAAASAAIAIATLVAKRWSRYAGTAVCLLSAIMAGFMSFAVFSGSGGLRMAMAGPLAFYGMIALAVATFYALESRMKDILPRNMGAFASFIALIGVLTVSFPAWLVSSSDSTDQSGGAASLLTLIILELAAWAYLLWRGRLPVLKLERALQQGGPVHGDDVLDA
jgi:hypothetical protein